MRISDWSSDVCSSDLNSDRRNDRRLACCQADDRTSPRSVRRATVRESRSNRSCSHPPPRRRCAQRAVAHREYRRVRESIHRRLQNLRANRSEEHTSELQSLMRISYAVFILKKKKNQNNTQHITSASQIDKPDSKNNKI